MIYRLLQNEPVTDPRLPDELVNTSETKRENAAIQSLKTDYRAVAILRGIQEYTPSEIALILGWTQNKVNVMFHRVSKCFTKYCRRRVVKGQMHQVNDDEKLLKELRDLSLIFTHRKTKGDVCSNAT